MTTQIKKEEIIRFLDPELGFTEPRLETWLGSFRTVLRDLTSGPSFHWVIAIFICSFSYHYVEQKTAARLSEIHVSWFITMMELVGVLFCTFCRRLHRLGLRKIFSMSAHPKSFFILAACLSLKRGLSNIALLVYKLDFPSYVVLKSTKVLVVMATSVLQLNKRYSIHDYIFAGLLAMSLVILRLAGAEHDEDSKKSLTAMLMMFACVVVGGYQNSQQEHIMREDSSTPTELMFFSNLIAVPALFSHSVISGEFAVGIQIFIMDRQILFILLIRGCLLFSWIYCCLRMTITASATDVQYVSTFRKLFQVILSLVVSRHFTITHGVGLFFFSLACFAKVIQIQKKTQPA